MDYSIGVCWLLAVVRDDAAIGIPDERGITALAQHRVAMFASSRFNEEVALAIRSFAMDKRFAAIRVMKHSFATHFKSPFTKILF